MVTGKEFEIVARWSRVDEVIRPFGVGFQTGGEMSCFPALPPGVRTGGPMTGSFSAPATTTSSLSGQCSATTPRPLDTLPSGREQDRLFVL
jgi:hypothetical protein